MASYKHACIHCNTLIDRDSAFCPVCGSSSPFVLACPTCLREIQKDHVRCAGCGRPLYIPCPLCGGQTFVQDKCERCGKNLTVRCKNKRCGAAQFYENKTCTVCGKKVKEKLTKK